MTTPTTRGRARADRRRRGAFTLVELLTVIVIIAIIVGLVMAASMEGLRSAEVAATQRLIKKLDDALSDRLEAVLASRPEPSFFHRVLSHVYSVDPNDNTNIARFSLGDPIPNRAYAMAMADYVKAELPDVFFVQDPATFDYPLNFASNPFPHASTSVPGDTGAPNTPSLYVSPLGAGYSVIQTNVGFASVFSPGRGIYGASYANAAGIYRNLGYQQEGYDGVDNDGDGAIDNWEEGVNLPPRFTSPNAAVRTQVLANLANHKHATARSEMLYALLIEGAGPWGTALSRDEFSDREVMDTDNDGLPEFVDAWGQPLQFYRWPILYRSGIQKGQAIDYFDADPSDSVAPVLSLFAPYRGEGMIAERERNPLDLNQDLVSPAWWWSGSNSSPGYTNLADDGDPNSYDTSPFPTSPFGPGAGGWSAGASAFEYFFHSLHENLVPGDGEFGLYWDRGAPTGTFSRRRAYNTKFLIVSAGPDRELGLFQYDDATLATDITASGVARAFPLIALENSAAPLGIGQLKGLIVGGTVGNGTAVDAAGIELFGEKGQDDITSHALTRGVGGSN